MEKRFLQGGTLVWWAFMPRSAVLFGWLGARDVKLPAMADPIGGGTNPYCFCTHCSSWRSVATPQAGITALAIRTILL